MSAKLEVCVDTAAGVSTCASGDVDRIELCSALALGGLTPTLGLIKFAARQNLSAHALIRPRAGDFVFATNEIDVMCADIAAARRENLDGVVIGASTTDGKLDVGILQKLIEAAGPLEVTLHRVIDTLVDPLEAVETSIQLGIKRILTSGGAVTAVEGSSVIAQMHQLANGRIEIMAGSGITPQNLSKIAATGVRDFHASCYSLHKNTDKISVLGFGPENQHVTSGERIKEMRSAISRLTK